MNLAGLRVLVTRPRSQAVDFAAALKACGVQVLLFPVIEIGPLVDPAGFDQALQKLCTYDWLVLTSVNGVQAVWQRLQALGIDGLPAGLQVAVIGPKTAAALQARGVKPDFIPDEYVAEAILPGLGSLKGKKVLLARADIARPDIAGAIRLAGGEAHEIAAYHTLPAHPDPQAMSALQKGVDILTFTSSSTVRSFKALLAAHGVDALHLPGDPLVAVIGPVTAATAREQGFPVDVVAGEYTVQGLLQALQAFERKPEEHEKG
jgi:uroporphyrinogen-III synthase